MPGIGSSTLSVVAQCLVLDALAAELTRAFRASGVDSVLLKGPATVRWLYPDDPNQRLYSDLDLLVAPSQYEAASAVLRAHDLRPQPAGAGVVGEDDLYSRAWHREDGERVDLHRGFHHVVDGQRFWEVVADEVVPLQVGGVEVAAPDRAGTALICALHATANGTEREKSAKPLEDLRRALARFDPETWETARDRADAVGAVDAFATGLRLLPAGATLASDLGLPTAARPFALLSAHGTGHRGDKTIALFSGASMRQRVHMLRNLALPSREVLGKYGAAESGPFLAYLRRAADVASDTPVAVSQWRTAVRSAERSGWRRPPRRTGIVRAGLRGANDRDRWATAWWTLRAVRAARAQLEDAPPDEVRLPPIPALRGSPRHSTVETMTRLTHSTCLESALTRQRWLAAAGDRRDLVLGVTAPATGFRAHAWLDGDRVDGAFSELSRFEAPPTPVPRLPDFVVIGAPKSGTTSLWAYLRAHPQVYMCAEKEPEFFNDERHWRRGVDWYRSLFAGAGDAVVAGEASVRYSAPRRTSAQVPHRMAEVLPNAKLVYVVRHPVHRMASQWGHNRTIYAERRPLAAALHSTRYLESSRYADRLAPFLAHYPPERVHVVVSERLAADREAELVRLFEFLGVDPGSPIEGVGSELNRAVDKPAPRPWMHTVMRLRGATRVRALLHRTMPRRMMRRLSQLTRTRADPVDVAEHLVSDLSPLFADDVRRLRPLVSGPFDGWGIA